MYKRQAVGRVEGERVRRGFIVARAAHGARVLAAHEHVVACLLYTSDAADERSSVDLGGRRIIKKKNTNR